jgi:hypothetical protein
MREVEMPRPKVILQLYPMLPAADEEDRKAKRPLGRNAELYHEVLHDWLRILKAAEELLASNRAKARAGVMALVEVLQAEGKEPTRSHRELLESWEDVLPMIRPTGS